LRRSVSEGGHLLISIHQRRELRLGKPAFKAALRTQRVCRTSVDIGLLTGGITDGADQVMLLPIED
jgi:hypothetical protein